MRKRIWSAVLMSAALALQGCASFFFDDEEFSGTTATGIGSCQDIEAEMLRVVAFVDQLNKEDGYTWQDVVVILENYRIGNSQEKNLALKTANERMVQLWQLRDAKKCGGARPSDPIAIPVSAPEVIQKL